MKTTRGGKRPGAGRPLGSAKGRTVESSSISMTPALWIKLDTLRRDKTRSKWIAERVAKARINRDEL